MIEEKVRANFRKATYGEKGASRTCGDCGNMRMIDFGGMKQPRCGFFGDGINKKYMISVKDTCDRYESSDKVKGDGVTPEEQQESSSKSEEPEGE